MTTMCRNSSPAASDHHFPTPDDYTSSCECGAKQASVLLLNPSESLMSQDEAVAGLKKSMATKIGEAGGKALAKAVSMDHRGGPDDDHYAKLAVQPIDVVDAWSPHWESDCAYYLGETVHMLARIGTKGQALRDLKKAEWLLSQAVRIEKARK